MSRQRNKRLGAGACGRIWVSLSVPPILIIADLQLHCLVQVIATAISANTPKAQLRPADNNASCITTRHCCKVCNIKGQGAPCWTL